jgi:hypothetical protein
VSQPNGSGSGYPLFRTALARTATEVATVWPGYWLLSFIPRGQLAGFLGRHVVSPNLEKCEALIDTFLPAIETKEDREHRKTMTRQERVDRIAKELADQGVEATGNFLLQMGGQSVFDNVFKAARDNELSVGQQAKVVFVDRAVQVGTVMVLNTALTKPNIKVQEYISRLYQHYFNVPPEEADERAARVVNERVPSLAGMVASIVAHRKYSLS